MQRKKIAVHIQSEVQFFSLAPLLKKLKELPYRLEIVTDGFDGDESGYKEMATGTMALIKKAGFKPKLLTDFSDEIFDIYLTPYIDKKIKAKCYLKYEYGTLNIKPNLTFTPEMMCEYHGFLCQSTVTTCLLQVYGKTFPVENLRFFGKKKKVVKRDKKQVLFAPTYNDKDDEAELAKIVKNLKKNYRVVVKSHHGMEYLKENAGKKQTLEDLADEYYGSEVSLSDLILKSDVCLFGNSSAIAEALYVGVPCAIVASDLDYFKLGDVHTTQYEFVQDDLIPYCEDSNGVNEVIKATLSDKYKKKQQQLAHEIFPAEYHTGVEGYLKVIEYFLNDALAQDYLILHDFNVREGVVMREKARRYKEELDRKSAELDDYSKRKLNKLAAKIYKIEGRIINGKG